MARTHTHRHAHACTRSLTHSDNYTNDRKSAHNAHESIKSGRESKCDVCMQWEAQRNGEIIKYTHPHTHTHLCEGTLTHTHVHNCMPIKPMLEPVLKAERTQGRATRTRTTSPVPARGNQQKTRCQIINLNRNKKTACLARHLHTLQMIKTI